MELNKFYLGDSLEILKTFPEESVDCVITSPPYFGLRDYGCEGQIGLEQTPLEYVVKINDIFREVKRLLKQTGTLWINLGDSYSGSCKGRNADGSANIKAVAISKQSKGQMSGIIKKTRFDKWRSGTDESIQVSLNTPKSYNNEFKSKNLIGIPWRVAFALQGDGWYLRSDIIWHKPNPMPESVTDRPTKAHEYVFLFTKSSKYFYDADAIKETAITSENRPDGIIRDREYNYNSKQKVIRESKKRGEFNGKTNGLKGREAFRAIRDFRNKRSVWTIPTRPYLDAHFAVFPEKLVEPMIKAGCHVNGIVLDPFSGSGTTCLVAKKLNRNYIGIELNPEYLEMAENRIREECGTLI